ncbi:MAG TPA: hypothetical protein EYO33_24605 [Phycisphaerales bacterium]|nr:hypothetical protein [Phycisphaerales bacterium]
MSKSITMPPIPGLRGRRTAPLDRAVTVSAGSPDSPLTGLKRESSQAASFLSAAARVETAAETTLAPFVGALAAQGASQEPLLLILLSAYAGPNSTRAELDDLEREALQRENEIRSLAPAEWAAKLPSDDDTWQGLNSLRHALIDKELDGGLTPEEKAILGALELLSDRRIREENTASVALAEKLLAQLGKDSD